MVDVTEVTQEKKNSVLMELMKVRANKFTAEQAIKSAVKDLEEKTKYKDILSKEAQLVNEALELFYPDQELEGVQREDLGNGWFLKATFEKKYAVDESKIADVKSELSQLPYVDVEDVFKLVHKFAKRGYKDLHDDVKVIADKALIVKPGKRTLEIVMPKVEK